MTNCGQMGLRTTARRWSILLPGVLIAGLALLAICAPAMAAERSLAGIRIFSTTKPILQKYKNPSEVIVGRPSLMPTGGQGIGLAAGGGYPGGGMGGYPGGGAYPGAGPMGGSGLGPLPSFAGGVSPKFGGAGFPGGGMGGYPGAMGMPGGDMPGLPPGGSDMPGMPGGAGGYPGAGGLGPNGAGADISNPGEVTWIYNRANGSDLEFTMSSDGRVVQIRATGYKNPEVKTSRGIMLGATYARVVSKYGYPESQEQMGTVLTIRYTDRDHCAFQFYHQKLVAIIVAAVE